MIGPSDFTTLYEQYRIGAAIRGHEERARLRRRQRNVLLAATVVLLLLAVVSDVLANSGPSGSAGWTFTGAIVTFAAMVVAAGLAWSGYGRQARLHQEAAAALSAVRESKPGPTAREADVSQWVWQAETIVHGALADPSPLRGTLTPPPAGRPTR